jgi:CheY-like chemotaxis protein
MPEMDPITLLVVDESADDCQLIQSLLAPLARLHLVFAGNGGGALGAIERREPDLLLTDLVMPGMDGLDLVRQVRARFPAIPIVLMTAHGSEEAAMRALRAGAANYIPKKDLARDLVETVQGILRVAEVDRQRRRLMHCLDRRETHFQLQNDPDLMASLLGLVQEEIDGTGRLDRTGRIRVGVALQEALSNALYHGNLELSSDLRQEDERVFYREAEERRKREPYRSRVIRVQMRIDRVALRFRITDEGPGFDVSRFDHSPGPEDLTQIGGRGLLLIRTFMDEAAYSLGGRSISMVKRFDRRPSGDDSSCA